MYCENQIISPRYGAPLIVLEEDGISGCFALTMKSTKFCREEAMKLFYALGITELPKPDTGKEYSGKIIFSQMLPKDLNLE
jgi:DNA-directed RNA polymerase subunit A'